MTAFPDLIRMTIIKV